jgi:hypothetical protein
MSEDSKLLEAIDNFQFAMKDRVLQKKDEGFTGWDNPDMKMQMQDDLNKHLRKELNSLNLVDIANYCMFLWNLEQCGREVEQNG